MYTHWGRLEAGKTKIEGAKASLLTTNERPRKRGGIRPRFASSSLARARAWCIRGCWVRLLRGRRRKGGHHDESWASEEDALRTFARTEFNYQKGFVWPLTFILQNKHAVDFERARVKTKFDWKVGIISSFSFQQVGPITGCEESSVTTLISISILSVVTVLSSHPVV